MKSKVNEKNHSIIIRLCKYKKLLCTMLAVNIQWWRT